MYDLSKQNHIQIELQMQIENWENIKSEIDLELIDSIQFEIKGASSLNFGKAAEICH